MNSNSPLGESRQSTDLRRAIEQQLDLILKLQQQRKALRKENKILHTRLKETNGIVAKYQSKQTVSVEVATESIENIDTTNLQPSQVDEPKSRLGQSEGRKSTSEYGVQVETQSPNIPSALNCSKLTEAQSFLKTIEMQDSRVEPATAAKFQQPLKKASLKQQKTGRPSQPNQQLAGEVLKLTKQLNSARRELKECDHKYKLRDKEIKQLKKCLEVKNEALDKTRREFNELSLLLNSDRSKSVRGLEQEIATLRTRLAGQEDAAKLKVILGELTNEYEQYKRQSERKIDILVAELAGKEKQIASLEGQSRKTSIN